MRNQVTGSVAMSENEFYADPTVFDLWQERASGWLGARLARLRPYVWSLLFSGLGLLMSVIAASVLAVSLYQRLSSGMDPAWNQSAAQWLTVLMALLSCHSLLQQALRAWPREQPLPRRLQRLAAWCGHFPLKADGRASAPQPQFRGDTPGAAQEIRAFFAGVRAAGVNVAIARALFAAGIRSLSQLRQTDDAQLLRIRGVGPATVRRLRAHFS